MINLPQKYIDLINSNKNVMYVGVGGGYDIFAALPLIYNQTNCILTNNSPSKDFLYKESTDFPELILSKEKSVKAIYSIGRHGVNIQKQAYSELIEKHNIDLIVGIDGGIDSLMHGDEQNSGTVLEDFITLAALDDIKINKILVCAGFGAETDEEINHYRGLENIAQLAKSGCLIGTCSLTKDMECYQYYKKICYAAFEASGRKSHIQTKIISSVEGEFADYHLFDYVDPRLSFAANNKYFISPLSSILWFFNMDGVIKNNLLIPDLKKSSTFTDAMLIYRQKVQSLNIRSKEIIPL